MPTVLRGVRLGGQRRPLRAAVGLGAALLVALLGTGMGAAGARPIIHALRGPDLGPGQGLVGGQALGTVSGDRLTLRTDGELVAKHDGKVVWRNKVRSPGARVILQPDGRLKEIASGGRTVWSVRGPGPQSCLLPSITDGIIVARYPDVPFGDFALWGLAPCYLGNEGGTKVGVVGDSITYGAQPAIEAALKDDYAYQISGIVGFRVKGQLPAIQGMVHNPAGGPGAFVVDLGTNDAIFESPHWEAAYRRALQLIGLRCTVLVTVNESGRGIHPAVAKAINRFIARQAAVRPEVHVLDWNALLNEDDNRERWLAADHVHPTAVGAITLALKMEASLKADC